MKLFIGNISYNTNEQGLRAFFEEFGPIVSAKIVTDRETGRSRGFGFVEYEDRESAEKAISARNGANLDGKDLVVNEARPKEGGDSRGGGGGGRFNRDGGGGRSGGGRNSGGGGGRGGYSGGNRW
jgi:cold-inducible RNA-binding protein